MNREDELLNELRQLHRRGLINDEEAIEFRKILKRTNDQPEKRSNSIEPIELSEKTSE